MFHPYKMGNEKRFYRVPKEFLEDVLYIQELDPTSILLYAVLRDRYELSLSNGEKWIDESGLVFCFYSRENLQRLLGKSERTIHKAIEKLKSLDLVREQRQGLGLPNKIYLGQVRPLKTTGSSPLENKYLVHKKISTNDTERNEIDLNETENRYMGQQELNLRHSFPQYKLMLSDDDADWYSTCFNLIEEYLLLYKDKMKVEHPALSFQQWEEVKEKLLPYLKDEYGKTVDVQENEEKEMMKIYLDQVFKNCNYSLLHYVNGDIRKNRYYEMMNIKTRREWE